MPLIGGNKHKVKKNLFMADDEKDAYDQIFLLALWCNFVIYKVRLLVKKFRLRNYNNELYLQPSIEENIEMVEKELDLQQIVELKLEDNTFQEVDEEIREKKIELIKENGGNHEMEIITWLFC